MCALGAALVYTSTSCWVKSGRVLTTPVGSECGMCGVSGWRKFTIWIGVRSCSGSHGWAFTRLPYRLYFAPLGSASNVVPGMAVAPLSVRRIGFTHPTVSQWKLRGRIYRQGWITPQHAGTHAAVGEQTQLSASSNPRRSNRSEAIIWTLNIEFKPGRLFFFLYHRTLIRNKVAKIFT